MPYNILYSVFVLLYIFTSSGDDIVVKISEKSIDSNTINYNLSINDNKYSSYLESFIITFIIFNHIDKMLNFSHDES